MRRPRWRFGLRHSRRGLSDPRAHQRGVVVNLDRMQGQGLSLVLLRCSDLPQQFVVGAGWRRLDRPFKRVAAQQVDAAVAPVPGATGPNVCRLQVFAGDGSRSLVVATHALPPPTGTSLTNGAEAFAESAWKTHLPDDAALPAWIEHYVADPASGQDPALPPSQQSKPDVAFEN